MPTPETPDAHVHEVDEAGVLEARRDLGRVVGGEAGPVALLLVADEPQADGHAGRPTAARTASSTSTQKRMRFSRLPPYSSVRRLLLGERNSWIRYPCAPCTSMPSKPPATALAAERAKYSTSSRISSCSSGLGGSL